MNLSKHAWHTKSKFKGFSTLASFSTPVLYLMFIWKNMEWITFLSFFSDFKKSIRGSIVRTSNTPGALVLLQFVQHTFHICCSNVKPYKKDPAFQKQSEKWRLHCLSVWFKYYIRSTSTAQWPQCVFFKSEI